MIPDRNSDLQEEWRVSDYKCLGKYKRFFNFFKYVGLLKIRIITLSCGIYNVCRYNEYESIT